jgi:hypothetical protein
MDMRPSFDEWKQLIAEIKPTLSKSLQKDSFWQRFYDQGMSPEEAANEGSAKLAAEAMAIIKKNLLKR